MFQNHPAQALREFLKQEASGGVLLMFVAALALLVANTPLAPFYFRFFEVHIGHLSILHWINDGLMALFFLLVTLEIKREFIEGQLSTWPRRILPGIAALGGMIVPAIIYAALNPETLRGWAVPTATDIAFALGVLALLGSRVPVSLKIFLTALAIIDDLGAVLIIAIFYTSNLSSAWLAAAFVLVAVLAALNRAGFKRLALYLPLGAVLWFSMLHSGIHASLSGVVLAMAIPFASLHRLEHTLHPWVVFLILPIFGFANAGVSLAGIGVQTLLYPVTLGIMAGLFFGKMLGVFLASYIAIKSRLAPMPEGASMKQLFGVSILCGIGFTMSLFIGLLAFPAQPELQATVKLGVLAGSMLSAIVGLFVLRFTTSRD